jgi:hypothetical protein
MAAVFLLLPAVGGAAVMKMAKKAANTADTLGDVGKTAGKAAKNADAGKGAAKLDDVGCHSPCPINGKDSLTKPGKFAGESIPARSQARDFSASERADINRIGLTTGCHICGTKVPGTKSGNFVPDHITPSALNPQRMPQRLYPSCLHCSSVQGGEIAAFLRSVK